MTAFASLFAGIGGFDLGLERAGMTCVAQVENDPYPASVLQRHWPHVTRHTDIKDVTADDLGTIDLLCGGFPCQDISHAGRRAGLAGERSGLWFEFARLIDGARPEWVVIENVAGLLSSNRGDDMAVILGTLEQLGYQWAYRLLDSQWFGVAQRRRRVFIVGHLAAAGGRAGQVLLESESVRRDSPPSRQQGQETVGTLAARTRAGGFPGTDDAAAGYVQPVAHTLTAKAQRNEPSDETLLLVGPRVRRLTPVECERLQGFPDGWTDNLSDTRRYRALGNAVTVNVAEWLGQRIETHT